MVDGRTEKSTDGQTDGCTVVQEDVILSENFSEPINVTLAATKHVL